jgi:hemolysin III
MTADPRELVPMLRGVSHAVAFWVAVAAAATLAVLAPTATARASALVYGGGLCALFAASATYHRWRWSDRWRPLLRRIDHSTIFVFIAASYTPVALLVLHGTLATAILCVVWGGALAGAGLKLIWIDAPKWLAAGLYVALGWVAIVTVPDLWTDLGWLAVAAFALGGALYTTGAVVYARERPDPWPRVFGYHEIFHALVVAAAAAHFAVVAFYALPNG